MESKANLIFTTKSEVFMANEREEARRYRDARKDAHIGAIEKSIEEDYGLPEGSVSIRNPDGKDARSDKKIDNLRKDHK
jgi:hypothetical protein